MNIVYETRHYFTEKIEPISKRKWRGMVRFGFEALSLKPLESLNANARGIIANRKTAESKIYRLVHTKYSQRFFPLLLSSLQLVQKGDCINVDFSDFHGRQVLMFAKQTHEGRAIPLYFEFLKYPIEKGSQNLFIERTIMRFLELIGVQVHLIFDRGLAIPHLVKFLMEKRIFFTIRIKKGKYAEYHEIKKAVSRFFRRDIRVNIYGFSLRIVRSEKKSDIEPWYLVTNDFSSSKEDKIERYYYRFEIEEFFRDGKHLLKLEYLFDMSDETFTILLWFILMANWVLWQVKSIRKAWQKSLQKTHSHHHLSLPRFFFEALRKEQYLLFQSAFLSRLL